MISPAAEPESASKDRERARVLVSGLIAGRWPGGGIARIDPVRGDASSRRYVRCRLHDGPEAIPDTVVVMLLDDAGVSEFPAKSDGGGSEGPTENAFVNVWRYLSNITDALPDIYEVATDASAIALEDVGDVPLWEAANAPGADAEALFGAALDLLADLQAGANDDGSGCRAFGQAFDESLFNQEFNHFLDHGLSGASSAALEASRAELAILAARLAALPRVFCHRDYHAWNLHLLDGRVRVIDFQDALMAPAMYDVASLLTDRITPRLIDAGLERRLVRRFADRAGLDEAEADEGYLLCALQRVLKVVGRFNYLNEVKGKPAYAAMLPDVVPTARALVARVPGVGATSELLEKHVKSGPGT